MKQQRKPLHRIAAPWVAFVALVAIHGAQWHFHPPGHVHSHVSDVCGSVGQRLSPSECEAGPACWHCSVCQFLKAFVPAPAGRFGFSLGVPSPQRSAAPASRAFAALPCAPPVARGPPSSA